MVNNEFKFGEWIPVTKDIPKEFESVLVWYKDHLTGKCGCDFAYQVEDIWYGSCLAHSKSVLAWMPKPQDYEGGAE